MKVFSKKWNKFVRSFISKGPPYMIVKYTFPEELTKEKMKKNAHLKIPKRSV